MRSRIGPLAVALLLLTAGCVGLDSGGSADASPTSTDAQSPTDVGSPTESGSPTTTGPSGDPVSVAYTVHSGDLPDDVRSLNLTVQTVFVADGADLAPCWRQTIYGPYKPTPTPLPTPEEGDCHRSEPVNVTLTGDGDAHSLGPFEAPDRFTAGHGFIVTDVTAVYENGTSERRVVGVGGHRANVESGRPDGSRTVSIGLEPKEHGVPYALVSTVEDSE